MGAGAQAARAGRHWAAAQAPYLVTAGHSVQGLRQVGRPLQQHFLGAGEETAGPRSSAWGDGGAGSPRPLPPSSRDTLPPAPPRPSEYLGQPLGISGVSGNDFLQPLEPVVNGGFVQGWGEGRDRRTPPPRARRRAQRAATSPEASPQTPPPSPVQPLGKSRVCDLRRFEFLSYYKNGHCTYMYSYVSFCRTGGSFFLNHLHLSYQEVNYLL